MQLFKQAYTNNRWHNTDVSYNVADGYDCLRNRQSKVQWRYLCWNSLNVPKCAFIYWAIMHSKLLTKDRLLRMGVPVTVDCEICGVQPETHQPLFIECAFTRTCSTILQQRLRVRIRLQDLVGWYSDGRTATKLQKRFIGACHISLMYEIWKLAFMEMEEWERNYYCLEKREVVLEAIQRLNELVQW
ncbi:uncharacterized protein LOC141590226 [Silene latifolia]|uniref:uncharacterized protein LOC141590226 n=1 Tax=Silene latifolia TaxID=37657 RepID=UPI003D77A012